MEYLITCLKNTSYISEAAETFVSVKHAEYTRIKNFRQL